MRPLETLSLCIDALAFLALAVPLPPGMNWVRNSIFVALPTTAVQAFAEGPRWQLVPGYFLTGVLVAVRMLQVFRPERTSSAGGWIYAAAIGSGAVLLAAAILLPMAFPVFRIPLPSGPYGIGTLTFHWTDSERPEAFTADPSDRRELMVQVWYPAVPDRSARRAVYVENADVLSPVARLLHIPAFMFGHLKYIVTNAVEAAPAPADGRRYPVLVFSHGRGGFRGHNTRMVEELVSQGYVVAAVDHTFASSGVAFPDGRVIPLDDRMLDRAFVDRMIPYLAQDAVFTLDRLTELDRTDPNGILTGRLDTGRAGVFGLSMGGEIAAESCLTEPRFRACLVMDVWMPENVLKEGLKIPAMFISRDDRTMRLEGWSEADIGETLGSMRSVFGNLPDAGYFVLVPGMFHQDFSDAPLLSPLTSLLGITGPIGSRRGHGIVAAFTLAFFDRHLKGRPEPPLDTLAERFPGVLFETRGR